MPPRNPSLEKKHSARLAAVQCLYQHDYMPEATADQLIVSRLGMNEEEDATEEEFEALPAKPDPKLLRGIVTGAMEQSTEIDSRLTDIMKERWSGRRMPELMRAVIRAASYEFIYHPTTPTKVILSEYTTLAGGFFEDEETGFVNAVLQEISRNLRP